MTCLALQGPKTDQHAIAEMKDIFMRGNTASARIVNYKKSGEPFWNLLTVTPVKNSSGKVTKLIGIQVSKGANAPSFFCLVVAPMAFPWP